MTQTEQQLITEESIAQLLQGQGYGDMLAEFGKLYSTDPEGMHAAVEEYLKSQGLEKYRIGTAEAMLIEDPKKITIVALLNRQPGNGDFQKLMDDLEGRSKPVIVEELWNQDLRQHLIEKRGYRPTHRNGNKRLIKKANL